jgi:HK97 family phage prohead protease
MNIREAAEARAAGVRQATDRPSQRRSTADVGSLAVVRGFISTTEIRAAKSKTGADVMVVTGYASTTETPYDMYDAFGPYTEVVSRDAFDKTLSASPLVEFTVNHGAGGSLPMAHTRNDTLSLEANDVGLKYTASVDPSRSDVADMLKALERGDLAESSFKFRIDAGQWSPDYTEFRINAVDINRGDVSAVNFGANPTTSVGVGKREESAPVDLRAALLAVYLAD